MANEKHKILGEYISWAINQPADVKGTSTLSGGVHNNICVDATVAGESQRFVIRKIPPTESFGFARKEVYPYALHLQFLALRDLERLPLRTPQVWGLDETGKFLDSPAFLMEFIEGCTVLEAVQQDPEGVVRCFTETIFLMNQISSDEAPSVVEKHGAPSEAPFDVVGWIGQQVTDMELPNFFSDGLNLLQSEEPNHRPARAFGNGDLNPMNFILTDGGSIAVVDWEFVGFSDPISELMLLHLWPRENPFLEKHPVDRLYCRLAGLDERMLPWYKLGSALSGWIYLVKDQDAQGMALHEKVAAEALAEWGS